MKTWVALVLMANPGMFSGSVTPIAQIEMSSAAACEHLGRTWARGRVLVVCISTETGDVRAFGGDITQGEEPK